MNGVRSFSVIDIGEHSIRNVHCSEYLSNYLNPGEEIELELSGTYFLKIVVLFGLSILLMIPIGLLALIGTIWFLLGLVGLVLLVIRLSKDMGHKVISVTVNGKKYRD